jgi:Tfp pilus assembly protein FimV
LRRFGLALFASAALCVGAPAAADASTHQVRPGDTLTSIALDALGDESLWPAIYLANRDQIKDPARVYPGQVLTIPDVSSEEREALRREADALKPRRPGPTSPQGAARGVDSPAQQAD